MLLEINFNDQLKDNPTYFEYSIYYDSEIRNLKKKKNCISLNYILKTHVVWRLITVRSWEDSK